MHFILDSIYEQYKSLYIFNLSVLKDIIITKTKSTKYGEYRLLDSHSIYKSLSITTLDKTTNETIFDKFQSLDPTLQPTDYPLATQLYDILTNSQDKIVEANVIKIGLLFNIHCFTGKMSVLTREAIQYSIFKTNMDLYKKERNLRLYYYSLTFNNETEYKEKFDILINTYKCDIIYFDVNKRLRDMVLIRTLKRNEKKLFVQISPQEGAVSNSFVFYAGYTIFAILDSLKYQGLMYNPVIIYDDSFYGRESILNLETYEENYNFPSKGKIMLTTISDDIVKDILQEYDGNKVNILLIMEQNNSIEFLKCLYPINQPQKYIVFSTTLDEMIVKLNLNSVMYEGHYIFGYYFNKATKYTDKDFEDKLNERYYNTIALYNNFIFPYYISKLIGNVISSVGVKNVSSLFILLNHKHIEGITGTIVYNSDNYLLSNINILQLAANDDDSVVYGGSYVIMNPPFYAYYEGDFQAVYVNDEGINIIYYKI